MVNPINNQTRGALRELWRRLDTEAARARAAIERGRIRHVTANLRVKGIVDPPAAPTTLFGRSPFRARTRAYGAIPFSRRSGRRRRIASVAKNSQAYDSRGDFRFLALRRPEAPARPHSAQRAAALVRPSATGSLGATCRAPFELRRGDGRHGRDRQRKRCSYRIRVREWNRAAPARRGRCRR